MTIETYAVELRGVTKKFGRQTVLSGLDLSVRHGEIVALLGPSGCGKSTTLNMIAGFFPPDEGTIMLDGVPVNDVPTHKRNLGMVFQNYSLFPHMSVFDNVAFGLSVRRRPVKEMRERVSWALNLVHLSDVADRFPAQLSGGQQQRIAVARALVVDPKVLLLDEPLSNLDAKLRKEMQVEFKRIQRDTGITMIHVTHDQEEAVTLADRIALLQAGVIEQLDDPHTIFEQPRTRFAAEFMGFTNFLTGQVEGWEGDTVLLTIDGGTKLAASARGHDNTATRVTITIREESVAIRPVAGHEDADGSPIGNAGSANGANRLLGTVGEVVYTGTSYIIYIDCQGSLQLRTRVPTQQFASGPPSPGTRVELSLPIRDLHVVESVN